MYTITLIFYFTCFILYFNIATSKVKQRGERGKFKSYIVDMKIKGQKSKLKVYIPDDIDRAIGDNARHFVNECGRIVRTRAPLNIKNWKEAFSTAGDVMWKEIEVSLMWKELDRSILDILPNKSH